MIAGIHPIDVSASKGDLIIGPLELFVEILARLLARIVGESLPHTTSGEWHWPQWTAFAVVVTCLGWVIWFVQKRCKKPRTNK